MYSPNNPEIGVDWCAGVETVAKLTERARLGVIDPFDALMLQRLTREPKWQTVQADFEVSPERQLQREEEAKKAAEQAAQLAKLREELRRRHYAQRQQAAQASAFYGGSTSSSTGTGNWAFYPS